MQALAASCEPVFAMTGKEALEPLVPTESSQDKGNFPVRSRPEENYPRVETSLKFELLANWVQDCQQFIDSKFDNIPSLLYMST